MLCSGWKMTSRAIWKSGRTVCLAEKPRMLLSKETIEGLHITARYPYVMGGKKHWFIYSISHNEVICGDHLPLADGTWCAVYLEWEAVPRSSQEPFWVEGIDVTIPLWHIAYIQLSPFEFSVLFPSSQLEGSAARSTSYFQKNHQLLMIFHSLQSHARISSTPLSLSGIHRIQFVGNCLIVSI